jgi:putative FmdB family regulatory protein
VPTYQYACTECGHNFDIVQSFSDDSLSVCPECGGRLRKVFNAVGVVFKGSGFYRTDSREAKSSGKSTSETSSATNSTGSGESTSSSNGSSTSSDAAAKKSSPASPPKKNTESAKS